MEALRELLGLGVVEFTDFIIKSVFVLFATIITLAVFIIWYKEMNREEEKNNK